MRRNNRNNHYTRPLHGYATEKLPPPSKFEQLRWFLSRIRHIIQRFYRGKIKQPLIAFAGLTVGFGAIYLGFNMQSDGPVRQQVFALLETFNIDSPVDGLQSLGDEIKKSAENSVLKDNMSRTRIMLEAYPVEGSGYPENVQQLVNRAKLEGYWALYKNPLTKARKRENILADFSDYSFASNKEAFAGMVLYEPMGKYDYRVYACDKEGQLMKTGKKLYYLSRP